jgi:hypothetical protein
MTSPPKHSLRQSWRGQSKRPFFLLVRLFVDRIFHGAGDGAEESLDFSLGLVLSLLALPGGFYSIMLFNKYGSLFIWLRGQLNFDPLAAALPEE